MDGILAASGLDGEFLAAAIADQRRDLSKHSAKQNARFARFSALCLRANVARSLLGLAHREFCARLADSALLQWFLHIGEVDSVKVFTKVAHERNAGVLVVTHDHRTLDVFDRIVDVEDGGITERPLSQQK